MRLQSLAPTASEAGLAFGRAISPHTCSALISNRRKASSRCLERMCRLARNNVKGVEGVKEGRQVAKTG